MIRVFLTLLVFTIIGPLIANAETVQPALSVHKAYAYATSSVQKNGAVFLEINNKSADEFKLISADSAVANKVELHTHSHDNGIMQMREVSHYNIPSNSDLILEPMGHHIMLMGLKQPLKTGDTFMLTLNFEHGKPIPTKILIVPPGAQYPEVQQDHE